MKCLVGDCEHEASLLRDGKPRDGGLCHAHAKRKAQGRPLSSPIRDWGLSPDERLVREAIGLADAGDDDEAFTKARKRLLLKRTLRACVELQRRHKVRKEPQHSGE